MESAKDYGFNEGFLLEKGALAPIDHTIVGDVNENQSLSIPNSVLDDEYSNYSSTIGSPVVSRDPEKFGAAFANAKTVLNSIGLRKIPDQGNTVVGVDYRGDPIYSDTKLANDKNVDSGKNITTTTGVTLGALGAFADTAEAKRFVTIGEKASNPEFLGQLDKLKANNDVKTFTSQVGQSKDLTEFTAYKLYENWNNLSPAQKSMAVAGTHIQGFRFDNGDSFKEKRLTPEIPGVPSMNAAEGLNLAGKGVNVAPATRKWNQYSALQETLYTPKKSADVVTSANSMGLLGHGMEGQAVPIDQENLMKAKAQPMPQYGIGAVGIPVGGGIPSGYKAVRNIGNKTILVPQANAGSVYMSTPDVATESATQIYKTWKSDTPVKQTKGVIGGSALAGGLANMAATNPYSLGALMTYASFQNTGADRNHSDLGHISQMAGISLERLANGNSVHDDKGKALGVKDGDFTEQNYAATMKSLRAEYAKKGISSKEIGYQLANQGYAEGRFDETQATTLHRTLDMVFDANSYTLAQKLLTGKSKGFDIVEKRRG